MTNLTISPLKLNLVAAAQGIQAQQQNQARVEANNNNNNKANDNKADLHNMSEAIKAAQGTSANDRTKSVVDAKLKELLADERGLVRVATLGKKNQTCTIGRVEMKISQSYDEKSQKLAISINANGYNKTEVKDMKALQGEIKAQNESDKEEEKRCAENEKRYIPQNPDGTRTIVGPNGERLNVRFPGCGFGR